VFGSRLKKGSRQWTRPARLAHDPFRSLGNAVIWQAPGGLVWLFYVVRYGGNVVEFPRSGQSVTADQAATWSDAFPLVSEEGMMVCNRPIVLHNGDYLLPLYHETGYNTEFTAPDSCGLFLRYDVKRRSGKQTGRIKVRHGAISSPCRWRCARNFLIAYIRRGGNFEPHHQRLDPFARNPAMAAGPGPKG
jgi:hypothetical protein